MKDEVAGVIKRGGGDGHGGCVGGPDSGAVAVGKDKIASREELKRARWVNRGMDRPDNNRASKIGDGCNEGGGRGGGNRDEAQGEGLIGGGPGLVWGGSKESGIEGNFS